VNRRPRRGVPAALIGLLLLAGCALIATDAIQILAGGHPLLSYPRFAAALHSQHWNSLAPAIASGGLAVLGVLLLLVALLPGRPVVLALSVSADDEGPTVGLSRRGFRNMLRATAASVDGVTSASLSFRRTVIAASVHTAGPADGLADSVRAALERRLDQIAPARRPALRVRARTRSSS
jgi:hypothetical protein